MQLVSSMKLIVGLLVIAFACVSWTALAIELPSDATSVFVPGKYTPISYYPSSCSSAPSPWPLLIISPQEIGTYPVVIFHHGTMTNTSWYSHLQTHLASHGYIIVAPQLYNPILLPSAQDEINRATAVANWVSSNLNKCNILPQNILADLQKLSLVGHSRGGYVAYALALGYADIALETRISSIAAIPVAGVFDIPLKPQFLTFTPCSFNLSIPVAIIGTGLGGKGLPCAPVKFSHGEFFKECKPPCGHFVVTHYGHMDVLDDELPFLGLSERLLCVGCLWPLVSREPMRRTVGGVIVAFLKGVVSGDYADYNSILENPNASAPAQLSSVQNKTCSSSDDAFLSQYSN